MCYEFDRLYWLRRAEEVRKELEQADELKKRTKAQAPPKPTPQTPPDPGVEGHVPIPA